MEMKSKDDIGKKIEVIWRIMYSLAGSGKQEVCGWNSDRGSV